MSGQELSETVNEKILGALGAEQWVSSLNSFFMDTRYVHNKKWESQEWLKTTYWINEKT